MPSGHFGWVKARQQAAAKFYHDPAADEAYRCEATTPPAGCAAVELARLHPFPQDPLKVAYVMCKDEEKCNLMRKGDVLKYSHGNMPRHGCKLGWGVVKEERREPVSADFPQLQAEVEGRP